jgi:hypothetical protein
MTIGRCLPMGAILFFPVRLFAVRLGTRSGAKRRGTTWRLALYLLVVALGPITVWVSTGHAGSDQPPLILPVIVGDGPGMLIPVLVQTTDLTVDQGTRVTRLLETEGPPMHELLKSLQQANLQLAQMTFTTATPRAADVAPALRRISSIRQEIMQREMAMLLRLRAVLKPEQLARLAEVTHAVMQDLDGRAPLAIERAAPIE